MPNSTLNSGAIIPRETDPKTPEEMIAQIKEQCGSDTYFYRGENCQYDSVCSGIYRKYRDVFINSENILPVDIEMSIVDKTRAENVCEGKSTAEILTDLQHFGGQTTLIDFSHSFLVALFFACYGGFKYDGRIIAIPKRKISKKFNEENYGVEKDLSRLNPVRTSTSSGRIESQESIFIHAPRGRIEIDSSEIITIPIPNEIKWDCILYLDKSKNIRERTIYNDLIGYIQSMWNWDVGGNLFLVGNGKSNQGKFDEAIEYYTHSLNVDPDIAPVWYNRGNAKCKLELYAEAIHDYDRAIELQPNLAVALSNRGYAKTKLKHNQNWLEGAVNDCAKAININPGDTNNWNNRGMVYGVLGMNHEAIDDFNEAIKLDDTFVSAWYNRGLAKHDLGRDSEAIADYDKAIELNRKYAIAWCNRGVSKFVLGRSDEAIADYNMAIELDPNNPEYILKRARTLCSIEQYEEAIEDLNHVIIPFPTRLDAWYFRGRAKLALGNYDESIDDLVQAFKLARVQGSFGMEDAINEQLDEARRLKGS